MLGAMTVHSSETRLPHRPLASEGRRFGSGKTLLSWVVAVIRRDG
jgi:hypothetical protein